MGWSTIGYCMASEQAEFRTSLRSCSLHRNSLFCCSDSLVIQQEAEDERVIISGVNLKLEPESGISAKKVRIAACGRYQALIVLDNGEAYGWGYNNYGQLGVNDKTFVTHRLFKIPGLPDAGIVDIACNFTCSI